MHAHSLKNIQPKRNTEEPDTAVDNYAKNTIIAITIPSLEVHCYQQQ